MLQTLSILVSLIAQAAPGAGADLQAKDRAQALLKEGSALYKKADFAAALQKFEAAYVLYPSPKLQFNIAQADRELGRIVEAVEAFEIFLAQAPDAAPEIGAEARQSLAELKPKLAQVRVEAMGGAQVTVDQRSLGVTPIARIIWVTPGRHRIAVKHPSYLPASLEVTVSAGEIRTVTPKLLRVGEVAAAPPPMAPIAPAPAPPPAAPAGSAVPAETVLGATPAPVESKVGASGRRPWYFWTAAAATAAFTAGAVIAGVSANGKYDDLDNGCRLMTGGCSESQIDGVKSRAHLATALWILAGASAVATGVTFYVGSRESGVSVAVKF